LILAGLYNSIFLCNFAKNNDTVKKEKNFVPSVKQKDWNVPQTLLKESNRTRLVEMLTAINKINDTTSYYIRDSRAREIMVDSPTSTILCGHTMEMANLEGFAFYERIFDKKEWPWLEKMFKGAYKIFYEHPPAKRKHLISCYDFTVQHVGKGDLVLRHKAIPLLLCDNGNLWLSLCSVTVSSQRQLGKATITNTETGELYEYTNGHFVLSDKLAVTEEDLLILELVGNDLSSEQIAKQLEISPSSYSRRKQLLLDKLGVKNLAGAIHKAHLERLI